MGVMADSDPPCEARVDSDCTNRSRYPRHIVAELFLEDLEWGYSSGLITGFLVIPRCTLTYGHCVYDRAGHSYQASDIHPVSGP